MGRAHRHPQALGQARATFTPRMFKIKLKFSSSKVTVNRSLVRQVMGLPFLFADSLRIGSTIIFPSRVLFGRIFLLVGMIIHVVNDVRSEQVLPSDVSTCPPI